MLNTAQSGGIAGADIEATEAWALNNDNVTSDGDTVVVAVIDDMFDLGHEDLNRPVPPKNYTSWKTMTKFLNEVKAYEKASKKAGEITDQAKKKIEDMK